MESAGLTCKKCKQTSFIPQNAQFIRCHGCNTLHPIENTNDVVDADAAAAIPNYNYNNIVYCKGTKTEVYRKFMKKFPFGNESATTMMPMPLPLPAGGAMRSGKRALICGVSYKKQKHELKGTAQDVKNMKRLLQEDYNFPTESIRILSEEDPQCLDPTRKNIEEGFEWLMRGIQPGDSLLFYFSGHGKRQREFDGDEIDGFDETICPLDFEKNGMIVDNYINLAIVRPLLRGVTLHAIIDSCHSGTILDLPNVYDINKREWDRNSPPSGVYKGTKGGKAICFSACEDYQLAADTSVLSAEKEMTGAMTITFINAIKESLARNEKISYHQIMDKIHTAIKQADKQGGFFAGIRRIFHRRILQDPLLSCSEEFDTSTEFNL